ncbi:MULTISPECIES: phage scaffolding protein [unclassified Treponema]|uniref:phage scaffolding protein n=1 Tax=unclassified Treponema TaxID=2638727 RepID=UPI0020A5E5FF|nr:MULTISPECIES: phage scaffolding protein [unclassified Treponema]UTC65999.1 phage scaffolding protein [Treponema sp. OMZ 789]UTC68729.1 phage scaffolding protein [Treponema sp. OMZ 790]UTC71458.1 phage scaffolding protein [Treponema sp. OMZ 791]
MKRDFLEGLNLDADTIDKIMAENGKDVNREKAKYADYDDIKTQLEAANKTIEKFKDYDETKTEVEKYKAENEKLQKEGAAKIAAMERSAKVKDYLSNKKFVNDITRDAIAAKMGEALEADASKGKNLDDIFAEITKDKADILKDETQPTPPVVPPMGGKSSKSDDDAQARAVMGLPPRKE